LIIVKIIISDVNAFVITCAVFDYLNEVIFCKTYMLFSFQICCQKNGFRMTWAVKMWF